MPDRCVPQDPHKHSDYPGSTMVIAETGSVEITGKTTIYWFTLERLLLHVAIEYRIMLWLVHNMGPYHQDLSFSYMKGLEMTKQGNVSENFVFRCSLQWRLRGSSALQLFRFMWNCINMVLVTKDNLNYK